MSKSKLLYNNDQLDYNKTANVRHNAFDIKDPEIGFSSKSYDLEIPLTPKNRRLLNVPDLINSRLELTGIFRLYLGGTLLIKGKLRVFEVNRETINGIIEATEWVTGLDNTSIRDLAWVAGDKHTFSSANVLASWLTTAATLFRYPLINFGALWSRMTGVNAEATPWDFVPVWNVYEIIKRIFKSTSYSLDSTPDEDDTKPYAEIQRIHSVAEPNYYHFGVTSRSPKTGLYVHITRVGNSHLGNEGKIVMYTSPDGITWTYKSTPVNSAVDDRMGGGGYDSTGRLFIHWNNYDGASKYNAVIFSDDDGETWTAEDQILVFGAGETGTTFGSLIELEDGTLIMSGYWLLAGVYSLGFFKSIDAGLNWTRHDIITTGATYTYSEGSFLYLGNNQILVVCRKSLSGANTTYHQFLSIDNGATWTNQGDTTFETWGVTSGRERPPYIAMMDYLGTKIVACYYVVTDRQKFRVVYGLATDALSLGVDMWKGYGTELLTGWDNISFGVWDAPAKDIVNAQEAGTDYAYARSNQITLTIGNKLTLKYTLTRVSGAIPVLYFWDSTVTESVIINLLDGYNEAEINITKTDNWKLWIYSWQVPVNFGFTCSLKKTNSVTTLAGTYNYGGAGFTRDGYQTVVHIYDKWQGIGSWYNEVATDLSDIVFFKSPIDNRVIVLTALGLTSLIDNSRNFFASGLGRTLYIMGKEPVNESGFASGKLFEAQVIAITDNRVTYEYAASETYTLTFPLTTLLFATVITDEASAYSNTTGIFTIPETGTYRFYSKFKIFSTSNEITDAWSLVTETFTIDIYNQTTSTVLWTITGSGANDFFKTAYDFILDTGYLKLTIGDEIIVRMQATSHAKNDAVSSRVAELYVKIGALSYFKNYHDERNIYKGLGDEISPVTYLPDITCLELLKALKYLFGLRFWVDTLRRTVYIYGSDTFITANIVDWTNFIDFSDKIKQEYIASNYKKTQILKYKDDSGDKALQDYILLNGFPLQKTINLTSQYCQEGIETKENPIFAPTIERYWFDMTGYVPAIWDDFLYPDPVPPNRLTEWIPRIFQWKGLQPKEWVYNANFLTSHEHLVQYPKVSALDIATLFGSYFQKDWHYIDKSKLLTITLIIDINKLAQFTTVLSDGAKEAFRATYKLRVDNIDMYFILNSMVTDGMRAKCEFIQKL